MSPVSNPAPAPRSARVRVASLNCWALPFGLARHTGARLQAIGERLASLSADVVSLQEVWTPEARDALLRAAREAGLEPCLGDAGGPDHGGLLLLSRLPVLRARFEPFTLAGVALHVHRGDYQGGKGFVTADLETSAGVVRAVATHLHARYSTGDPYLAHRVGQVLELAHALRDESRPVVAAGDFNIREGTETSSILRRTSGLRDAAVELGARFPTVLAASPYRGGGHRGDERIDYVFVRHGGKTAVEPRSLRRIFDEALRLEGHEQEAATYSDHAGLLAEIALRPGDGAPPPPPSLPALERAREILLEGREKARERLVLHGGVAVGSTLAAGGALMARRRDGVSRRRVLRLGSLGLAGLAAPWPLVFGASAAHWVPGEIGSFDRALEQLAAWIAEIRGVPAIPG